MSRSSSSSPSPAANTDSADPSASPSSLPQSQSPSAAPSSAASASDEQKQINEEYKIWKKNSPFLYDLVLTHALEWPSLTCQWMPDRVVPAESNYSIQRLLIGTHTSDNEQNSVLIVEVRLPLPETELTAGLYQSSWDGAKSSENNGYGGCFGRIEIVQQLHHNGDINRARYCWQREELIATKSDSHEVYLFDRSKHEAKPLKHAPSQPELRLLGHSKEGYGLCWSHLNMGHLISGAEDKLICLWDIGASPNASSSSSSSSSSSRSPSLNPLHVFKSHTDIVEDVSWHHSNPNLFGSCGDDHHVMLWDTRKPKEPVTFIENAHNEEVNCLSFNPFDDHLFVTGSADKTVGLWDRRNPSQRLHSFEGHQDQIFTVQWSPHNSSILASCSSDRRVNVWDMSRIGEEQDPEDAEDGPAELLFIHGGHTDKVADLCWNQHEEDEWTVVSVADDNVLQIWQMASNIYDREELEDKEKKVDDSQLE